MLHTNDPSVNQHKKLIINTTTSFLSLDTMGMLYVTCTIPVEEREKRL